MIKTEIIMEFGIFFLLIYRSKNFAPEILEGRNSLYRSVFFRYSELEKN